MPTDAPWSQHDIDRLKEMWPNFTAAEIAATLGEGLTRNAVMGMVHRLKLGAKRAPPRPRTVQPVRTTPFRKPRPPPIQPSRPHTPLPEQPSPPLVPSPNLPTEPVTLNELTHKTCRWPIGDVPPFLYCGKPPLDTSPYCARHHGIGYYPLRSRL